MDLQKLYIIKAHDKIFFRNFLNIQRHYMLTYLTRAFCLAIFQKIIVLNNKFENLQKI